MREQIIHRVKDIEQRYNVRVLLAVESGSRAWGFASPDSDYDVRFVYVHPMNWYLSLQAGRDVIEELDTDGVLDVSGWDLKKALLLMGSGNCSFAEWLASPIIYYKDDEFYKDINAVKGLYFRQVSAVNHYYHVAMNHDKRYLEKRGYEMKRFMYHIRGLLAAKWAIEKNTYPPVPFMELVDSEVKCEAIKAALRNLVALKSQSKEHDKCTVDDLLLVYATNLAQEISVKLETFHSTPHCDLSTLNALFLKYLKP